MPKQNKLLYLFLFSLPIMAMLLLARWNYLQADDYICHWLRQGHGFWGMQQWIYLNNTGRYTSALLAALASENDIIFRAPWLFPVMLIIAEIIALFILCKTLGVKNNISSLTLSLLIFLIHINILPEPATAIYWFSGAATYQVSFILFILLAASVHWMVCMGTMGSLLAASLLIILIGGTNEMSALLVNLSCVAIAWQLYQQGRIKNYKALTLITSASLSLLILFLSPGIWIRQSYMPEPQLLISLPATIAAALYSIWEIFSEPAFWLAAALVFYFSNTGVLRLALKPRLLILLALIQLASLAIILFSTHGSIPLRMLNVYTSFNTLLLLLLVARIGNRLSPLFRVESNFFLRMIAPITAVIILFSGLSGSLFQSFLAAPFAKTVQQQWIDSVSTAAAKGEKYVALPSARESTDSLVDRSQLKTVMKDLARRPPSLLHYNYGKSNEITFYHLIVRNDMDSVRVGSELFGRPEWAAPASR